MVSLDHQPTICNAQHFNSWNTVHENFQTYLLYHDNKLLDLLQKPKMLICWYSTNQKYYMGAKRGCGLRKFVLFNFNDLKV